MSSTEHFSEERAFVRNDPGAIFVSLELSRSTWLVTSLSPGGGQKMSRHQVRRGDVADLLARFSDHGGDGGRGRGGNKRLGMIKSDSLAPKLGVNRLASLPNRNGRFKRRARYAIANRTKSCTNYCSDYMNNDDKLLFLLVPAEGLEPPTS